VLNLPGSYLFSFSQFEATISMSRELMSPCPANLLRHGYV